MMASFFASFASKVPISDLCDDVHQVPADDCRLGWCGLRICQKRNGSTILRSYFGEGFEVNGGGGHFYTRDRDGSVSEVVASDGTTVESRLSYDPWGKVTENGSGLSDFTYTGHFFDRATGLTLAPYRGYDPSLGRWLSTDPIGLRGGLNLYGYVGNDPTNFFDPDGKNPAWGAAIGGAIGGPIGAGAGLIISGAGLAICILNEWCLPHPQPFPQPAPRPSDDAPGPMCRVNDDADDADADDADADCAKERREAAEKCGKLPTNWHDPNSRRLAGNKKRMLRCIQGQLSARCGGGQVSWPNKKPHKRWYP